MVAITQWMGTEPGALRRAMREDRGSAMRLRRAAAAASLLGIASMAATTLFQLGAVKHLPDPPVGNFHSDKVNSSDEAYSYGGPDSPVTIAAHAGNIVLAGMGGPDRAREHPWLPLLAALFAGAQAGVAAKYLFYQMPKVDRAWCPYCITDALTHFAVFALTLPEAAQALRRVGRA